MADQFIAECEYSCGWSYGPASNGDCHREAARHDPKCYFGGPVIRNIKDPAPSWTHDPLLD